VLELKHEMVNLELLEFHYFDDILTDMKLTPVSPDIHHVSSWSRNETGNHFISIALFNSLSTRPLVVRSEDTRMWE